MLTPCPRTLLPCRLLGRLQLPNGEMTSQQLRYAASVIRRYGADGCADITTRANLQLRGVRLEDADEIMAGLIEHKVRNRTYLVR